MRPGDLLEQRYRLVRVLGRGRSGSVWCARNELIDRPVAIKVLHRALANDPDRLQRFFQEARACGRVRHPSVVEVLDLGQADESILFLVMELLDGETLSSLLARRGMLHVDESLALMVPIARGLEAAHAHGILHRDLKPANVYLHRTPTGSLQPKILDFGISKILGNDFTAAGVVLGTPSYMSPEQVRGDELDARTDLWSLGVILFEALTGRLPFLSREYRPLCEEILERPHPNVRELAPETSPELAKLVDELLEKSRDRRLSTASSLAQRLVTALRNQGREELIREPDEEFSEGAPTLAHDVSQLKGLAALRGKAEPPPNAPAPNAPPSLSATEPSVVTSAPAVATAPTKKPSATPPPPRVASIPPGPQPFAPAPSMRPTPPRPPPSGRAPSPTTAAIAAKTAGGRRPEQERNPRPAAGAPPRPTPKRSAEEKERAEKPTDPPPRAVTREWEVVAAQAASGRLNEGPNDDGQPSLDSVITSAKLPRPAPMPATLPGAGASGSDLDDVLEDDEPTMMAGPAVVLPAKKPADFDETFADMKPPPTPIGEYPEHAGGPLPRLAPGPDPLDRAAPEASRLGASARATIPRKDASGLGAIPGFSAPAPGGARAPLPPPPARASTPPPPKVLASTPPPPPARRTPPPPPKLRAAPASFPPPAPDMVEPREAAPAPITMELAAVQAPPVHVVPPPPLRKPAPPHRPTLRPPAEGFAAPAPTPSAPIPALAFAPPPEPPKPSPPQALPSAPLPPPPPPRAQQPLPAELLALAQAGSAAAAHATTTHAAGATHEPALPSPGAPPPELAAATLTPRAPTRRGLPIVVPALAAASLVLFALGASLGGWAAVRGKRPLAIVAATEAIEVPDHAAADETPEPSPPKKTKHAVDDDPKPATTAATVASASATATTGASTAASAPATATATTAAIAPTATVKPTTTATAKPTATSVAVPPKPTATTTGPKPLPKPTTTATAKPTTTSKPTTTATTKPTTTATTKKKDPLSSMLK
jgi:serine/threonine-protein kinase